MKTNALLAFFFFLVALLASTRAEFVRDSEGHLVANGDIYYLVPQYSPGAVITGTNITNPDGSCSVAAVEMITHNNGTATLIETKLLAAYITTDYPLHISFHLLPPNLCTNYTDWVVVWDEDYEQNAVMVGDAVYSGFYFKTYDSCRHFYSLVFCVDQYKCGQVVVKTDGHGNKRLIVAAEQGSECPLVLKLVKQSDSH
ncbi:hypothetical protein K1719_030209 [Acacia pycnantha]|nr:hypothetical protein K1719_030209 [Acacia pycnantha]